MRGRSAAAEGPAASPLPQAAAAASAAIGAKASPANGASLAENDNHSR